MFLVSAALAWRTLAPGVTPSPTPKKYRLEEGFCGDIQRHVGTDVLNWKMIHCDDVRAQVREGLDVWQHNGGPVFLEVEGSEDVLIKANSLSGSTVGRANFGNVEIDASSCWHSDRDFCHSVDANFVLLNVCLATLWGLALSCVVLWFIVIPLKPFQGAIRLLLWTVCISVPLFYVGGVLPCLLCQDFRVVLVHEVGHVLGLDHPDVPAAAAEQNCGCGNASKSCNETRIGTVMQSTVHSSRTCLTRDDVDGLRTLYPGVLSCDAPIWCYDMNTEGGFFRIAVSLLYGFLLSCIIVGLRDAFQRSRKVSPTSSGPKGRPGTSRPGLIAWRSTVATAPSKTRKGPLPLSAIPERKGSRMPELPSRLQGRLPPRGRGSTTRRTA